MVLGGASHSHTNGVHTMSTNHNFDTRRAVEERYRDEYAPMSEQDRADFDATNRAIVVFGWLVVLLGVISCGMIAFATFLHFSR